MRSSPSPWAFGLVCALGLGVAKSAAADEGAPCPYPASDGAALAERGLVRAARAKLASCVEACTGEEQARCRAAADALRVPTIVVHVTDAAGALRADVRVVVDGEDAKPNAPLELDPGSHLVQVQGPRIGEQRKITVDATTRELAVDFATPKNAVEVEAEQGGQSPWPWVFIGVGFTGIGLGMILAIVGEVAKVPDEATGNPYDQVPNPTLRAAGIGSVAFGIAFVGSGIIWHFLDRTGAKAAAAPRAGFSPYVGPNASFGLMFSRAF